MRWLLKGNEDGGEVFGIGVISEHFHSEGSTPVVKEELKIIDNGTEIVGAVFFNVREKMSSGPRDVFEGMWARRERETTLSGDQRRSAGQGN